MVCAVQAFPVPSSSAVDMTDRMETLGSPLSTRYPDSFRKGSGAYARNIWTMCAFDGRVYIGCGNSSNGGPATGCGPVPIFAYEPKSQKFIQEGRVPDEQIDVFRVFSDGALYIPGHDPTENWRWGNFYRRRPGADATWEKVRTLPMGLHCYDMVEFDGRLILLWPWHGDQKPRRIHRQERLDGSVLEDRTFVRRRDGSSLSRTTVRGLIRV